MKVALLQLSSSDDPAENLQVTLGLMAQAVAGGAEFILTPEVTNCVSASRTRQNEVLQPEAEDQTLAGIRRFAQEHAVWVLIGSLALKTDDPDGRFANRSYLIGPDGQIVARYDKIHMFDVQVSENETYRESAGYRPGSDSVLAQMPEITLGMTVCFDVRFPYLFRDLAQAGAQVITVPSAFSPVTGDAHWHILLRARAIETGSYILAPAQTGTHQTSRGKQRRTYGHSLAVDPWGRVLLDAGTEVGVYYVELTTSAVADSRRKIPSLSHDRDYLPPKTLI